MFFLILENVLFGAFFKHLKNIWGIMFEVYSAKNVVKYE